MNLTRRAGVLLATVLPLVTAAAARAGEAVSLRSLLGEMVDIAAPARWPDPPYTCRQASSYDRRSRTPADRAAWFANDDWSQFLRSDRNGGREEWVMMDADGPGAVVRFWTGGTPPDGKLRIYLDGAAEPALEAVMADLFSGKGAVPPPLSAELARGLNLWLPIPYRTHCRITYEDGPDVPKGRWYNIEYRTYPPGTVVETFKAADLEAARPLIERTCRTLLDPPAARGKPVTLERSVQPGQEAVLDVPPGPGAIDRLELHVAGDAPGEALRSAVLRADFDGAEAIWCPVGDFFGSGVGLNPLRSWYRDVSKEGAEGTLACRWVMPYAKSGRLAVVNLGKQTLTFRLKASVGPWEWDGRSMHFHATWRQQRSIPTRPFTDWRYLAVEGKGVYVGDSLALYNPVRDWWGEGDEKISVDGEAFPSHFGTGTEDYYCYAWGTPQVFQHPWANQPRADGPGNRGHVVNTRTRSLDAIPFRRSLHFDMELWHWADVRVDFAATTYWYAAPGATAEARPLPEEAAAPIPVGAPTGIAGALECERMEVVAKSAGVAAERQDDVLDWSGGAQLLVKANKPGDFLELLVAQGVRGPRKLTLHATTSYDFGILRLSVNGKPAGRDVDFYSKASKLGGPLELGVFEPKDGRLVLRAEVVGGNPAATGTRAFFGLDCIVPSRP